jgi:hypothetical protein
MKYKLSVDYTFVDVHKDAHHNQSGSEDLGSRLIHTIDSGTLVDVVEETIHGLHFIANGVDRVTTKGVDFKDIFVSETE